MIRIRLGARLAGLGAGAMLVAGCQTVEPPAGPVPKQPALLYPGVPVVAKAPAAKSPASEVRPVVHLEREGGASALPPAAENTLDLGVALRLAGANNPTINLAREVVREALANQLAARSLLLPSVNIGGNFRSHQGAFLAAPGFIRDVDIRSLYLGAGAGVVGSGTANAPGVRLFAHLGDAAYEPLAARQRVTVQRSEERAVQNAILLDVATAYLSLIGVEGRLDVLRRSETELEEVLRLTRVHAQAGQGRLADANRVEGNLDLLRRDLHRAEEEVGVASAQLCRLLNLDPGTRLRTPGGSVPALRFVPENADTEGLIAQALRARPEVFARSAAIAEAQTRARQERVRPWLPVLSVGYSYGGFGGGSNQTNPDFSSLQGRSEFDAVAVWTVQNLGFGNRARVNTSTARLGGAIADYDSVTNRVRREVAEALADARAAATQIKTAESSLAAAEEGLKLEMERIKQGPWRPIQVLDSFRQLLEARQELLRALVAFDVAQFRLFVAVGNTPAAP